MGKCKSRIFLSTLAALLLVVGMFAASSIAIAEEASKASSSPETPSASETASTPAATSTSETASTPETSSAPATSSTLEASSATIGDTSSITISEDASSAALSNESDTFPFGISDFSRSNKGTNKLYNDTYYGYRWPVAAQNAFAVIIADGYTIIYIPAQVAQDLNIDVDDTEFQNEFLTMLAALDTHASNGGPTLERQANTYYFTSETSLEMNGFTYAFGVEVEDGHYYATATLPDSDDASEGGIYAESGVLAASSDTSVITAPTGFAALARFFEQLDWSPLWVSLKTTGVAIIAIFILGLLAAWGTLKVSDRLKGMLDTVFTIPMVLPPTVCGFLLLLLFGNSTEIGRWLIAHGINLVFSWPAAVISCIVVGFPLMYRTARGAFESLSAEMLDAARTLGWSEKKIYLRIMIPLAWPTIASGTVLAFARAMGEFGCTLFFAGNYVGITQTIPIAIYYDWMAGSTDVAIFWVIVVILISFLVILFINVYSSHTQRYRINPKKSKKQLAAEAGEKR